MTLWWGLFDQDLYVEFEGKRFGPYQPSRGAIPLYRYRKYQKSRAEERLDKVVRLADQLGLPRAAVSGADRPLPSLPLGAASMQVRGTPFPEPEAGDIAFPTPLAVSLIEQSEADGGLFRSRYLMVGQPAASPIVTEGRMARAQAAFGSSLSTNFWKVSSKPGSYWSGCARTKAMTLR